MPDAGHTTTHRYLSVTTPSTRLAISSLLLVHATNAERTGRTLAEELDAILGSRPPQAVRHRPLAYPSRSLRSL